MPFIVLLFMYKFIFIFNIYSLINMISIRAGIISRAKAIELVRHYDPIKPRDLTRWLDYVGMSEVEFDAISDTFRDHRVWGHNNEGWLRQEFT